jgi:hypothetical protein
MNLPWGRYNWKGPADAWRGCTGGAYPKYAWVGEACWDYYRDYHNAAMRVPARDLCTAKEAQ